MRRNTLGHLACVAGLALASAAAHAETYGLLIGISDYPDVLDASGQRAKDKDGKIIEMDLAGPVNDVKRYKDLLVNKYGVKPDNVRLVLDRDANEKGFVDGMKWVLNAAKPGDQIFFFYSGHGSQINASDEPDGKEEVLCLADGKVVPGDLFNQIAGAMSTRGVNMTLAFDSCFSGGMSRPPTGFSYDGMGGQTKLKFVDANTVKRFSRIPDARLNGVTPKTRQAPPAKGSFAFIFAGREDQPTTDLNFKDPKQTDHGLFTLVLTGLLEQLPDAPLAEAIPAIAKALEERGFKQVPQFESSSPERGKLPFLLKG